MKCKRKLKDIWNKVLFYIFDRQAWRRYEDRVVRFICGTLLVASIFFFICIVIVSTEAINDGWRFSISAEGVKNMQLFWQDNSALLKAFLSSLTLLIACHTLMKYMDVETCRSLGEIRTKLNDKSKKIIHDSLLDPQYRKDLQDKVEIYFKEHPEYEDEVGLSAVEILDYLGTLELGALMLRRGILSNNEFFNQFGYRYVYLSRSQIMDMINEEKQFYEPLLYAMDVANKMNDAIKAKNKKLTKEKDSENNVATV